MKHLNDFELKVALQMCKYDFDILFIERIEQDNELLVEYNMQIDFGGAKIYLFPYFAESYVHNLWSGTEPGHTPKNFALYMEDEIESYESLKTEEFGERHVSWIYNGISFKYDKEWEEYPEKNIFAELQRFKSNDAIFDYAKTLLPNDSIASNFNEIYNHCIDNFVKESQMA